MSVQDPDSIHVMLAPSHIMQSSFNGIGTIEVQASTRTDHGD